MMTGENQSIRRKICPSITRFTTNTTRISLGLNPGLSSLHTALETVSMLRTTWTEDIGKSYVRVSINIHNHIQLTYKYVGNSISKLQIQVTTYVFEVSAGNCHR